jgi:hypothetical protein
MRDIFEERPQRLSINEINNSDDHNKPIGFYNINNKEYTHFISTLSRPWFSPRPKSFKEFEKKLSTCIFIWGEEKKIKESAFFQKVLMGSKADMSKEDYLDAFDIEAERQRMLQEAYDAGLDAIAFGTVDNYSRNMMKYLKERIAELDKRKEEIFKKYNDEYLTRIAKDDKEGSGQRGESLFNLGMYNFAKSIAGLISFSMGKEANLEFEKKHSTCIFIWGDETSDELLEKIVSCESKQDRKHVATAIFLCRTQNALNFNTSYDVIRDCFLKLKKSDSETYNSFSGGVLDNLNLKEKESGCLGILLMIISPTILLGLLLF